MLWTAFRRHGGETVIPESAGFDPEEIAHILSAHRNVSFFAAPTMVNRLINHGGFAAADHRGLRTIIYGGAPMHFETLQGAMNLLGPKLAQIYGQGEVPMTITALSKELHADRTAAALARDHGLGWTAARQCRGTRRR